MDPCTLHPHVPAHAACSQCARPFCEGCLVLFQGRLLCGECRNQIVARMQGAGEVVYTPARRQAMAGTAVGILMAVFLGLILFGILLAVVMGQIWPSVAWIPGVGGFVLGSAGMLLLATPLSQLGGGRLREDVTRKLMAQGLSWETLQQGYYAGISPGELLRNFHGDVHWDIGYLLVGPGWLAYYGDQCHFSLRPDQVTGFEIRPPRGNGVFTVCRLMIRWADPQAGLSGVMNVMATQFRSRKEARGQLETLRGQLEAWRAAPVAGPVSAGWPLPPVTAPGFNPVAAAMTADPGGWWRQLVVGLGLAIPAGVFAGLMKKLAGVEIPLMAVIVPCIMGSFILGAKWNQKVAERKASAARERQETGAGTDGGATTLRT